jgi:hypothetical protein
MRKHDFKVDTPHKGVDIVDILDIYLGALAGQSVFTGDE